ncbi:nitroreductase family protein [Akkermansiaceae bacterium]|nr:nitroreductase family protein [Akkermansiaceae bacterium]
MGRINKAVKRRLESFLHARAGRSRLARILYYGLVNPSFDREMQAVLAGRCQFKSAEQAQGQTRSLLRRNIHRLEKGLIMRPRRSVFALEYIEETVRFVIGACALPKDLQPRKDEMKWAVDVLTEYFSIVGQHTLVDGLRKEFAAILAQFGEDGGGLSKPYFRHENEGAQVSYDALKELARQRRSVRWFQDRRVPRELIDKAMDIARQAPSACNRQPFFFHVFDDAECVKQVADLPGGTKGFSQNFPMVVAVVGELRNYYGERDRHVIYIDAALAAMSFMLAAETLGLSTCCINWPDIEEDELRADQLLRLEPDQRPIFFLAVGFADKMGGIPFSQKKPLSEILKYNWE